MRPDADRGAHGSGAHGASRVRRLSVEAPPILMGHSPAASLLSSSWIELRCAAWQSTRATEASSACRCHRSGPASPCSKPRQPHKRLFTFEQCATCSQHVQRGGGAAVVRALPHPCLGRVFWAARSRTSILPHTRTCTTNPIAPLLFISGSEITSCPRLSSALTQALQQHITDQSTSRAHLMPSQSCRDRHYALYWRLHANAPATCRNTPSSLAAKRTSMSVSPVSH